MERVIVRVRGEQKDLMGEKSSIEMVTEGRHYYKSGKHYVLYDDTSMEEVGKTATILKIAPDSMTLLRHGGVEMEQHFALSEKSISQYRTPYGDLEMVIMTDMLAIEYGTATGRVDIGYDVSINGQPQSHNLLHIEVSMAAGEADRLN
ncbi:MAG: DUF1934 domain-containing protein [Schwartzia sp.]|nr:DUF1934 domain-containing protein [Schwartzia sp. (in: firmicutes)]